MTTIASVEELDTMLKQCLTKTYHGVSFVKHLNYYHLTINSWGTLAINFDKQKLYMDGNILIINELVALDLNRLEILAS